MAAQSAASTVTTASILSWIDQLPATQCPFPGINPLPSLPTSSSRKRRREEHHPLESGRCRSIPSPSHDLSPPRPKKRRSSSEPPSTMDHDLESSKLLVTPSQSSSSSTHQIVTPKRKRKTESAAASGVHDGECVYSGYIDSQAPKDQQTIGFKMSQHGLKLNDRDAFDRYPEFKEKTYAIVDRASVKNPEPSSEKKFRRIVDDYGRSNEATFLGLAFPIMIKDGYFVIEGQSPSAPLEATFKDFIMDEDIAIGIDRELRGTLLPHKYRNQGFEKEMTKALRKDDGMKNAKPDYIYGISARKLPIQSSLSLDNRMYKLLTIAQGMYHPFLLVEGKSDAGSVAQATDQARRGGATLVHAARIIADLLDYNWEDPDRQDQDPSFSSLPTSASQHPCQQIAPIPTLDHAQKQQKSHTNSLPGPDVHTFVYSAVVSPQVVTFYAHWHEQVHLSDATLDSIFHMNTVASQSVHDERRALGEIRRVLHNICKWGVGERFQEHVKIHEAVRLHSQWSQHHQQTAVGAEKKRKLATSDDAATSGRASVLDNLELESEGEGEVAPPTSTSWSQV